VFVGLMVIMIFAVLFYLLSGDVQNLPPTSNFLDYIGLSAATFATGSYGAVVPATIFARLLATIERVFGVVLFGFLVAALYRRISKR
jgi:hypothetical protein